MVRRVGVGTQGIKSFVLECPEFALRSLGENLPWIEVEPRTGNFVASFLVADSPEKEVPAYQDKMQTALASFTVSKLFYDPHLVTAIEEDELIHQMEKIVEYLRRKGKTISFQIAHELKIDPETCNILLSHLFRSGKIVKEGQDWNNAEFFVS